MQRRTMASRAVLRRTSSWRRFVSEVLCASSRVADSASCRAAIFSCSSVYALCCSLFIAAYVETVSNRLAVIYHTITLFQSLVDSHHVKRLGARKTVELIKT